MLKRLLCSLGGEWQEFRASKYVPRVVGSCAVHFFFNFILNSTFMTFISEECPKFALVKKIHILFL